MVVKITMLIPLLLVMLYFIKSGGLIKILNIAVIFFWFPLKIGLKTAVPLLSSLNLFDLGILIILLLALFDSNDNNKIKVVSSFKKFPFWAYLLYLIGAMIAHYNSNGSAQEMEQIRTMYILPGLIIFSFIYIIRDTKQIEIIVKQLLISAAILGLLILIGEKIGIGGKVALMEENARLSYQLIIPFIGKHILHMNQIGMTFAMLTIISFSIYLNHPSRSIRLANIVLITLFSLLILKTNSRHAIIGLIFGILLITLLSKRFKLIRQRFVLFKGILFASIFIIGFVYLAVTTKDSAIYERGFELINSPFEAVNVVKRIEIWKDSLPLIFNSLLGFGLFGFPMTPDGNTAIVHNMYFFVYFSTGIIGFIAFLFIHINILKRSWKGLYISSSYVTRIICVSTIGIEASLFVAGIASPMRLENWQIAVFWIYPALMYSILGLEKQNSLTRQF